MIASGTFLWGLSLAAGLLVIVCLAIAALSLVAAVARLLVFFRYQSGNRVGSSSGMTGLQAARALLDAMGMREVSVEKAGFWRATFWGNSYSARKKTIFLRRGIVEKNSVTAVALAAQKVGLAVLDRDGDRKFRARSKLLPVMIFSPFLVVPLVLVGFVLDLVMSLGGTFTIVGAAVGLAFYAAGFVVTMLNLPVESKAIGLALDMAERSNLMQPDELARARKIFSAYKLAYVTEFIMALLQIIKIILKIIAVFANGKK